MSMFQMDLFSFAASQAAVRKTVEEVKAVIRKKFHLDGKNRMPATTAARIEANLEAIRLLKSTDL